jgi:branched-chain amino acid transport system permease protein
MLGGLYSAISIGLSLIFGVIRVINFAQGGFLMLAAYSSFWLWKFFRIDPYLSLVIVGPLFFVFGYAVQHWLIRPIFIREKALVVEPLGALLLTVGLDLVMANLALFFFGSEYRAVVSPFAFTTISLGFLEINFTRFFVFLMAFIITGGLYLLLNNTEMGMAIRSVGQNREAAALCGINVYRTYDLSFGIGIVAVALAAASFIPFIPVSPAMGGHLGIKSFIVVVLGGLGSIPGALIGGIILGVVESVGSLFVPGTTAYILSFVLFIIILLFRPKGIMGVLGS